MANRYAYAFLSLHSSDAGSTAQRCAIYLFYYRCKKYAATYFHSHYIRFVTSSDS